MKKSQPEPSKTSLVSQYRRHALPVSGTNAQTGAAEYRIRTVEGSFVKLSPAEARAVYVRQLTNAYKPPDASLLKRWKLEAQKEIGDKPGAEKARADYVSKKAEAYKTPAYLLKQREDEALVKFPDNRQVGGQERT